MVIFLRINIKLIVIYVSILGGVLGYIIRNIKINSLNKFFKIYFFRVYFSIIIFIPNLSTYRLRYLILDYGKNLSKIIDIG